jgi:hypothetical protein
MLARLVVGALMGAEALRSLFGLALGLGLGHGEEMRALFWEGCIQL